MPGYGRSIVQTAQSIGLYAQHEWKPNPKWTVLSGIRADQNIIDGTYTLGLSDNEITFNALTINPRVQLMHLIDETWQFRTGFSTGYRAPQAFDEDLHIETVNGAAQFVQLSNDLRPERSQSFSAGLYKDAQRVKDRIQLSVEGFYTLLNDPFIQVGLAESTENAPEIFEKRNSPIDAQVAGMNLEFNWTNTLGWEVQSGFTIQKAIYESPVEIYELADESTIQTRNILRTPNLYGHVIGSYKWNTKWRTSLNVDYTGRMEVPYEGPAASLAIRTVRDFYEVNASVERYVTFNQHTNVTIKLGVQNIFNAYQNDFDTGRFRDAAYIYGSLCYPEVSRLVYSLSIKIELGIITDIDTVAMASDRGIISYDRSAKHRVTQFTEAPHYRVFYNRRFDDRIIPYRHIRPYDRSFDLTVSPYTHWGYDDRIWEVVLFICLKLWLIEQNGVGL